MVCASGAHLGQLLVRPGLRRLVQAGVPVVCGSTGWLEKAEEVKQYCNSHDGTFLYASNFSVGVNIFFEINKKLAALMASHPEYAILLEEIHHTQKKDAPSGTAITLAEQIMESIPEKKSWVNGKVTQPDQLEIRSKRIDPAAGTHKVLYHSAIDDIEFVHRAHNRKGFATGAMLAAEFIQHRKGIFSMKDVLGF